MTAKGFLTSASEMNRQIHYKEIELKSLRDLASGISGCGFGERLSGTRNTDPPFVKYTDKRLNLKKKSRTTNADCLNLNTPSARRLMIWRTQTSVLFFGTSI